MHDSIIIRGARVHNLKNISLEIPRSRLVVVTGLSGSGKSTLAFDILHKEGQRQYLESLGMVDYMGKPDVDSITGLSPSISVDQHLTNHSPRSTVGTVTEVYTYLRVLFARVGVRPCPHCGTDIPPVHTLDDESDEEMTESFPCPHCGGAVPQIGMAYFSFNKPEGACPTCTGIGTVYDGDLEQLIDPALSVTEGGVIRWDRYEVARYQETLKVAGRYYGFDFDPTMPIGNLGQVQRDLLLYGVQSDSFRRHVPEVEPPETVAKGRFEGVITNLMRRYEENSHKINYREKMERLLIQKDCPDCGGTRLKAESRQVRVAGQTIMDVSRLPLTELAVWVESLSESLHESELMILDPILIDLRERLRRLMDVGVGYLSLDRSSPTLSAGEAQRLRLAALLGSGLTGVLYVLDEPTTGLHQRDAERLIKVLRQLRDLGNTVLVVEHDVAVIAAADYVIDMGPGAGKNGGKVVAVGAPSEITHSLTGKYLSGELTLPISARRSGNGKSLIVYGARAHNLKNITVRFPLGLMTAVTGVSGSGKSSLMFDIVDRAARRHFHGASQLPGAHDTISGWQHLQDVVMIDQAAIGRTPRSNAATYTDVFTPIRQVYAALPEAGSLTASQFSFNVPGGRCERCQGAGVLTINMHFLPDVEVRCPVCHGKRFKSEVLAVKYGGYSVADILEMTIEEAYEVFREIPSVADRLALMMSVGLGYLPLGQPATTLSGGEAQRIKLAKELARRSTGRTLYLLDEPTTGLHPDDVGRLLSVLQRLVDTGNTVIVVEHHLDIIRAADWIIDLGPEGGESGGQIMAQGTPEDIALCEESYTGQFLRLVTV
ncbi:MAG: excinuclease ABC subunit UvrA [Anaerolineae bacterium]|nr:excinuclease ABC subunit UvrA [Anaerolineae bacterium]